MLFTPYKRNKNVLLYVLIFIFVLVLYLCFLKKENNLDSDFIKNNRTYNDFFVTGIKLNDSYLCYNKHSNIFYINKSINDLNRIKIISSYDVSYIIEKTNEKTYDVLIYSDKYYKNVKIEIVDIPLISITTFNDIDAYKFSGNYPVSNIKNIVYNSDELEMFDIHNERKINFTLYDNKYWLHGMKKEYYSTNAQMYNRGATSTLFPKKAYRITLDNSFPLLGMTKDKDWILDALYTDESKIRNILSSNMWDLINNNQKIDNDLDGRFVEVFIDNDYYGLYVVKEKVNKKLLDIGEEGIFAKSIYHMDEYVKDSFIYNNLDDIFDKSENIIGNFELKYFSENSVLEFYMKLRNIFSKGNSFNNINDTYDFNNYLNYKILVLLIDGVDNYTKNQYLSMSDVDSKIMITPWDMDLTWGLYSSSNNELLSFNKNDSYKDLTLINCYNDDMDSKTLDLLKERYWELRKDVITMDTINEYLDSYKDVLINSGAAKRDSERWYEYDIEFEIEQIREWAKKRIEFLDEYFR